MFEFHGWISLSYHTHDTNSNLQEKCIEEIKDYLSKHQFLNEQNFKLIRRNGLDSFNISGQHNHRQEYVIEIFKWIGKKAIGSYGILYIKDGEDLNQEYDYSNEFRVWVLKRSELKEYNDPFLSPAIPEIEDEYDETRND